MSKTEIPSIRFRGFDDAWEQRKLGDVVKEITRNDPESEAPIMMITANNGFIEQSERYAFNNAGESLKKYILLKKGELAYNHGASKLRPYGSCFALTIAENARIPFVYHCFSAENQNAEFMSIELNGAEIENQLRKIVSSGARMDGLLNISFDEYTSVSVLLPGTEEQDRIADFFHQLDNLITLHQRKVEKLTNVKKSMLEKMFPQNGSSYPEIRFKGFTDPWEQRKVGDLLIERNQQAPMSDEYPLMAFIASEGVAPKGERYDRSALVTDTVNKLYKKTEKGDFIYSSNNLETGSIGLNKYGKACISPVYSIFEPTGIADSDFLGRRLVRKDFINAMVKWRQGVIYGQWRIHESDFLKIEITVPSVEEQRKIGAYLDQLDNLITLHQRQPFLHSTPEISLTVQLIHPFYTSSWEQRKLGDIGKARSGVGFPDADQGGLTGVPFFKVSDMNSDGNENEMTVANNYVTAEQIADHRWSPITELPAIFFAKVGAAVMLNRKRLCRFPFLLDNNTMAYSLSSTKWDADFAKALFGTVDLTSLVQVGALPSYNARDVESMEIYLPSLLEQEQIGAYFKHLDHLITLHQRKGKAAVSGCSNDANNSKGVCCKARDFGYKCHKKDEPNRFDA